MEEDDQDIYVAQLREVFDSCDSEGKGFLNKQGLVELCQKLQLEDQVPKLIAQLLGDRNDGEVNFDDFKEGFVIVLSDAIDGLTVSSGDEPLQGIEEPPKMVVNEKRYGRRSRPFDMRYSDDNASADEGDIESISGSRPGSPEVKPTLEKQRRVENGDIDDHKSSSKERRLSRANSQKLRKRESLRKRDSIRRQESQRKRSLVHATGEEILEASGQVSHGNTKLNSRQSNDTSGLTSPTEEQQLKEIWSEVNVGANGFLDKNELSVVCEHIGMEGMDEDELSLLFDELDDDHDGQVSFEEFLHGLFMAKDRSQESDPPSHSDGIFNGLESPRGTRPASRTQAVDQPLTSTLSRTVRTIEGNLFQVLDPENTGLAKIEDIRELWQAQENMQALQLLKHAEVDSEGKVSLNQLTAILESAIYDKSDLLCQAVVSIFKHELTYMRNQMELFNVEKEKLLENANNLVNEKAVLIRESEESIRQLEHQHEMKVKQQEEEFNEKLQQAQQRAVADHEKAVATFSKKVLELEREIERYKAEEVRAKQEIGEKEDEIGRLDSTLNDTQETLEESERVRARLEKELGNASCLSKKLSEVINERDLLKQQQNQHATKGIRELEKMNRQLRDENDELRSEVEMLKTQAKTNVKRNRSHRRRTTDRITRVGSVLSDYTKPVIIKRNKDGNTSSDDSEHDVIDGKPSVVRVSGDGGSNEDEQKNAAINSEQQKTIEDLTLRLSEHEKKVKELENTIRLQEQNIKAKDGSINKQKTSLEKLKNEMKEKTADLVEKSGVIEKLNNDFKTKDEQTQEQESKIKRFQEMQKKNESTIWEHETMIRNLKSELESLQRLNSSESGELKERFNKELGNLTSQFTTEMEEMTHRFSLDKEQIEGEFHEKYEKLKAEYEGTLETLTALKTGFKQEKEMLLSEARVEKAELNEEFQKQKQTLEAFYQDELESCKQKHREELQSLEDVVRVMREEKKQLEGYFEKEKVEISQQFAAEKAEIEQEKAEIEERLSVELERERERFVSEKTNPAADYEELKKALEDKFLRDKTNLEKNFARQKFELEETVNELRQIFTMGEEGLKGKLKEDFLRFLSEHKSLLDEHNKKDEEMMGELREQVEEYGQEVETLNVEISNLRNNHRVEMDEIETRNSREYDILELEMTEKLAEKDEQLQILYDKITSLTDESSQLNVMAQGLEISDRDDRLEKTRHEVEQLRLEIEQLREDNARNVVELEESVERLRSEKDRILENEVEKLLLLEERVEELETENARLKRLGNEQKDASRVRSGLERKIQSMEREKRELVRARTKKEGDLRREIERLNLELEELQDLMNRRNEVVLAEKARKDLYSLERTVQDMETERKTLENSLYQQNIKNTSLQDEISDLKRRHINLENRYESDLDTEKEKVNLVRTEMSTAKSKYSRDLAEVREKLDRALSNNERDQSTRDKILNEAKVEILTLSKKLEDKAKRCRHLEDERSAWEERVRMLDRQKREMELRVKKTQDSVDDHVTQLSKQLEETRARNIRTDTLVQELYIENAQLTKNLQETEGQQKKAEKSNRQLMEQKRALQRVISKLCGANALA